MPGYKLAPVAAVAAIAALPAAAQADRSECSNGLEAAYSKHYRQVAHQHGTRAPGRNIRRYGKRYWLKPSGVWRTRTSRCSEVRRSNEQLKSLLTSPAYSHSRAVRPRQAPAGVMSDRTVANGGSSNPRVNPACESGGNPQVVSPSGVYWGKYQFDRGTWIAHGGSPGAYGNAPEWEQDRVAARVTYDAWPSC